MSIGLITISKYHRDVTGKILKAMLNPNSTKQVNSVFSSPELLSYCDHFLSVVRPCVRPLTFSNDFSSETAEPILLKFHMEPP